METNQANNGIPDPNRPPIPNHPLAHFFETARGEAWDAIWEEIRLNRKREKEELARLYPESEDE